MFDLKEAQMQDLTIVIPTKNPGEKLRTCLSYIGKDFAKKIIVIESNQSIQSEEICKEFAADFLVFKWNGKYPKKRNWLLLNHTPETKWVLFIDDDELITKESKLLLIEAIQKQHIAGYWLKYERWVNDKKLKFGYPLFKLALFQTNAGLYERIEENYWSSLDMEIHEHPILAGPTEKLNTNIIHQISIDAEDWQVKHEKYAKWEAQRILTMSATSTKSHSLNQKIKYAILRTPFSGFIFFTGAYLLMGGFLDGVRGFEYAYLKAGYFNRISSEIKNIKEA
jgi:glycosyltransferase involved in cell wall biosynthesis